MMKECSYYENGMCVHPRNNGKPTLCHSKTSFEQEASGLIERIGLEEAIKVASLYMNASDGGERVAWEEIVNLLIKAKEATLKLNIEGGV